MCEYCGVLGMDPASSQAGMDPPELDLPPELEPKLVDEKWMITLDEAKLITARELRRIGKIGRANGSIPGTDRYMVSLRNAAYGLATGLEFRADQLAPNKGKPTK